MSRSVFPWNSFAIPENINTPLRIKQTAVAGQEFWYRKPRIRLGFPIKVSSTWSVVGFLTVYAISLR